MTVAIVHDYLTQRGGAERVVLALRRAFPGAPVYTSLYEPGSTFPELAGDVRTSSLDRVGLLRRRHRLALPLLARTFTRLEVDADVAVCSTSGWAHGAAVRGRKVVYCHAPARWLYQRERYAPGRGGRAALRVLGRELARWDERAALSADRYLVNSNAVRTAVGDLYGIDAEVVAPPPALGPAGPSEPVPGLEPGFVLLVSRLLPYKNVDAVCEAFARLPHARLVVAGDGPEGGRIRRGAPENVLLLGRVSDAQLRWLYARCAGLVAASYEDFGLTPLEAAAFGRPSAALRFGGYRDTVVEEETGVLFERPEPGAIRAAVARLLATRWDKQRLRAQAELFSERRFAERVQAVVAGEAA